MSWEIKIDWDECPYLNNKADAYKYDDVYDEVCGHIKSKTHECNKKNCPIKV